MPHITGSKIQNNFSFIRCFSGGLNFSSLEGVELVFTKVQLLQQSEEWTETEQGLGENQELVLL